MTIIYDDDTVTPYHPIPHHTTPVLSLQTAYSPLTRLASRRLHYDAVGTHFVDD